MKKSTKKKIKSPFFNPLGLVFSILVVFTILFLSLSDIVPSQTQKECLELIADNYCKEIGGVSLGSPLRKTFICGASERTLIEDGTGFRFTENEILICKEIGKK